MLIPQKSWIIFNIFVINPSLPNLIIIIFYFENVTFFHAKLGSDVRPIVDNQTSGDTWEDWTRPLVEKSLVNHSWVFEGAFVTGMSLHTNQFRLGKRHLNLGPFSVVFEFPPPYFLLGRSIVNPSATWKLTFLTNLRNSNADILNECLLQCSRKLIYQGQHPQVKTMTLEAKVM